jgi:hypothetical protein
LFIYLQFFNITKNNINNILKIYAQTKININKYLMKFYSWEISFNINHITRNRRSKSAAFH